MLNKDECKGFEQGKYEKHICEALRLLNGELRPPNKPYGLTTDGV